MPNIRPKAVCVCRRRDSILLGETYDAVKGEAFFVPPGGGIEFGETAVDAVRREIREELDAEVDDLKLCGVLESVFTHEGQPGHEIVFVFEARLVDATIYEREEPASVDADAASLLYCWRLRRNSHSSSLQRIAPPTPAL